MLFGVHCRTGSLEKSRRNILVPTVFGGNAYHAVTIGRYAFPRGSMGTRWASFLLTCALLIAMTRARGRA